MNNTAVIGVDLGGTNVRAGYVHNLTLQQHAARPISSHASEETVLCEIEETIEQVFAQDVVGIGVGVPSLVDIERGIVYSVENIPAWQEVHLKARLQDKFNVPVYINNDANCFALGESYFGKGRGYRHMIGLIVGTGMGAGVIINSRLYNGANCGAGEFGNIIYKDRNLEYYCSGQRFYRQYGINGEVLCEWAQHGDDKALGIFKEFGVDMGQALQTIMYALDPEIIVFGGSVSKAFPYFEQSMKETMKGYAYPHALARLKIECTENGNIAILGAAALFFDAQKAVENH